MQKLTVKKPPLKNRVLIDYFYAKNLLKKQLLDLGIIFFNTAEEYEDWSSGRLDKSSIAKLIKKKYLDYIIKNNKNYNYKFSFKFYDLVASYKVLQIISLSKKSHDILKYGNSMLHNFKFNCNILDLGCNIGYLSAFYSKILIGSSIIGFDRSKKSIERAKKLFKNQRFPNLTFTDNFNILSDDSIDYISDTQCLCTLGKKELLNTVGLIKSKLKDDGELISISNLPNEIIAKEFLRALKSKGFFLHNIKPLLLYNINGMQAYTELVFKTKYVDININVNLYFENIRKKISIVNLSNLI